MLDATKPGQMLRSKFGRAARKRGKEIRNRDQSKLERKREKNRLCVYSAKDCTCLGNREGLCAENHVGLSKKGRTTMHDRGERLYNQGEVYVGKEPLWETAFVRDEKA